MNVWGCNMEKLMKEIEEKRKHMDDPKNIMADLKKQLDIKTGKIN